MCGEWPHCGYIGTGHGLVRGVEEESDSKEDQDEQGGVAGMS